jgi:ferredoxin, 2Fe-2S
MIKLTFVQPDGSEVDVLAAPGDSVMQVALANRVQGISADCNGSAACATCHAFFAPDLLPHLPPLEEHENDLLDFAATERQSGSRLSCQIIVSAQLDRQKITLPDAQ